MQMRSFLILLSGLLAAGAAHAQKGTLQYGQPPPPRPAPPAPPRVWQDPDYRNPWVTNPVTAPATRPAGPVYVYDQRPMGGPQPLVTEDQAQKVINRFKEVYPQLGSPRLLIYVNRDLVDEQSGMKLIRRHETIESVRGSDGTNGASVKSTGENTYRTDGKAAPTLADRQTVRDVERLFGRPLRAGGASLADQRVASQLIADRPLAEFIGSTDTPQARKDREALGRIADAVIEVLVSSKTVQSGTISGTETITIPDIQATAISLKDSKILGQASSADVTGRVHPAQLGRFSVNEVAEATVLVLMEDMASR
jgi:hypothetical protein